VVCGDYELDEIIGGGSFGHVYSCRNVTTGKHYAVK
jgi:serine/threonine protein kinase